MKKIISSIRNEALSIESLLIDLDPLTWSKETSFKSWSPEIIISHLLYFDRMTIYSHQDKDKFNREASFLFKAFSSETNSLKRAKLVFDRLAIHEQSSMIDGCVDSIDDGDAGAGDYYDDDGDDDVYD